MRNFIFLLCVFCSCLCGHAQHRYNDGRGCSGGRREPFGEVYVCERGMGIGVLGLLTEGISLAVERRRERRSYTTDQTTTEDCESNCKNTSRVRTKYKKCNFYEQTVSAPDASATAEENIQIASCDVTIWFKCNSSQPDGAMQNANEANFENVAAYYRSNPEVKIHLYGYASSNTGSRQTNENLSKARVKKVASILKARGIPSSHIKTTACGARTQPYDTNETNQCVIITFE